MRSNCAILCLLSLSWRLENIAFCEFLEGLLSAAREAEAAGASLDDVVELAALPHLAYMHMHTDSDYHEPRKLDKRMQ